MYSNISSNFNNTYSSTNTTDYVTSNTITNTITSGTYTIPSTGQLTTSDRTYTVSSTENFTYEPIITTAQDTVEDIVKKYIKQEQEKEKNNMNDFNFGPFNTNDIRLSLYGMAIKNKANKWVCYDRAT